MKIAILGAPGTGKTRLAQGLRLALEQSTTASSIHIADAPPFMAALLAAITRDPCLPDTPLALLAQEHHRSFDLTLITGMDLPWVTAGAPTQGARTREQMDSRLRQILNDHAIDYTVVVGTGKARTDCALQAIAHHSGLPLVRTGSANPVWQWNCEKCSDADCEHRLFSALLKA